MRREEVINVVQERLDGLGVRKHTRAVRMIPSSVEVQVVAGDSVHKICFRSGITRWEFDMKLSEFLEKLDLAKKGQKDIEVEARRAKGEPHGANAAG